MDAELLDSLRRICAADVRGGGEHCWKTDPQACGDCVDCCGCHVSREAAESLAWFGVQVALIGTLKLYQDLLRVVGVTPAILASHLDDPTEPIVETAFGPMRMHRMTALSDFDTLGEYCAVCTHPRDAHPQGQSCLVGPCSCESFRLP